LLNRFIRSTITKHGRFDKSVGIDFGFARGR
jgi:hypothetical protein